MVDRRNRDNEDMGVGQMTGQLQEMLDREPPEYTKVIRFCG